MSGVVVNEDERPHYCQQVSVPHTRKEKGPVPGLFLFTLHWGSKTRLLLLLRPLSPELSLAFALAAGLATALAAGLATALAAGLATAFVVFAAGFFAAVGIETSLLSENAGVGTP
jgi:hypothetical protein